MKTATLLSLLLATTLGASVPAQTPPLDVNARPPCTSNTASCLEKIAGLYLEALRTHDGAKLPLAANVRRTENALTNARGPYQVRESFARTTMVEATRDPRFFVAPRTSDVIVLFRLDVDLKQGEGAGDKTTKAGDSEYRVAVTVPAGTYTVHEAERFRVIRGYITEIEIIAHVENGKGAGSGWPNERPDSTKPAAK
jgi:hypothetical protein